MLVCAVPTQAGVLSFDDLQAACDANPAPYPLPGGGTGTPFSVRVSNGYGGLNWNNFTALDAPANAAYYHESTSGGVIGLTSGAVDLLNSYANPATILATSTPFVLHSAYLTGNWNDGLIVEADGYLGGVLQYSKIVSVSAFHPTLVSYDSSEVDKVVFSSSGGTRVRFTGSGTHFIMDDLSYDLVPEPSALVLLAVGLAGLLACVKRTR